MTKRDEAGFSSPRPISPTPWETIERGSYDAATKTLTHVRGCHYLTLRGVFDGMTGNPEQDCNCGAYEDYLAQKWNAKRLENAT